MSFLRKPKPRKWMWVLVILASPCLLWIIAQASCDSYEVARLRRMVDESKLPGVVVATGASSDWPFNSNGAYYRFRWLISSDQPAELQKYVRGLESVKQVPDAEIRLTNLGAPSGVAGPEFTQFHEEARLYLLVISWSREPLFWEIPD